MSLRARILRSAPKGLAASLSLCLPLVAALGGCGGPSSTEKATVVITEPVASSSAAGPAAAPGAPAPTAAAPTETAKTAEAAAPAAAGGWGTLKGRVVFSADAPAAKILIAKGDKSVKDGEVCAKQDIPNERLVVNAANKGVRYAIVYLPKPTAVKKEAEAAAKAAEVIFDQKNCTFLPHVLVAMKGAVVTVKNSDAVGHNANAVGLINTRFNMTTPPGSPPIPQPIRAPEPKPGDVNCDIHNWMKSYWFALGNPYFAVTDADGNFEIKDVPAGDQKVVVWAESLGPGYITPTSGESITIKADGETSKDFTLDAAKVK